MRFPWANIGLLLLLLLQLASGYLGLVNGEARRAWLLWLHGIGAYGIVLLLFWKGAIIWNVLGRGKRWTLVRVSFLVLLTLLLIVLTLGLLWTFGGLRYAFGFSLVSLHIYLAIPLMLLLGFHVWRMRWILGVSRAVNRRAFLRIASLALGGTAAWWILRLIQQERRFTGSYEVGSFGGWFPRVSWINDNPQPVNQETWRLALRGLVQQPTQLTYEQLLQMSDAQLEATLDCTGGWYTTQTWGGVNLLALLERAGLREDARSVTIRSITGYWRRFPLAQAEQMLLASNVAGEPLSHGHGFPVRLVVPGERGFNWVKWVTEIQVTAVSARWQPPLPLQ